MDWGPHRILGTVYAAWECFNCSVETTASSHVADSQEFKIKCYVLVMKLLQNKKYFAYSKVEYLPSLTAGNIFVWNFPTGFFLWLTLFCHTSEIFKPRKVFEAICQLFYKGSLKGTARHGCVFSHIYQPRHSVSRGSLVEFFILRNCDQLQSIAGCCLAPKQH